jgi:hypothetical protein
MPIQLRERSLCWLSSHSELTADLQKIIIKMQILLSTPNVCYQETANVMWLLSHVRCRSKHTKNFSENY